MSAVLLPVTAFVLWRVFFCVEMACPCDCRRLAVKGVKKCTPFRYIASRTSNAVSRSCSIA